MASISTVVTMGYGSFGSVNLVPTLGYGQAEAAVGIDRPCLSFVRRDRNIVTLERRDRNTVTLTRRGCDD